MHYLIQTLIVSHRKTDTIQICLSLNNLFNVAGFLMGRLCISDQLDSPSCVGVDVDRSVQSPCVCCILYSVLTGDYTLHADLICRIPARTVK